MSKSYNDQMHAIVDEYIAAGQPWPATSRQIAMWAIDNELWDMQRTTLVSLCADRLAKAMRDEYIVDPQGRTVRAKHAARIVKDGEQSVFWDDIRTADSNHMTIAFQQRRKQIVGDCRQLKTDVDSYNDNRNSDTPIQMFWDFTDDIIEAELVDA